MPSLRIIKGFNQRKKERKPTTPLQQQLVNTRQRDFENAEASMAAVEQRLNKHPVPIDDAEAENHDVPALAADDLDHPGEEAGEEELFIDLNRFMPGDEEHQAHNNPIMAALRREVHLADRLAHESDWLWQYAIMLPTFLQNRMETSNWGNQAKWNQDLRPPCNCTMRTERDVDLIDILLDSIRRAYRRLLFSTGRCPSPRQSGNSNSQWPSKERFMNQGPESDGEDHRRMVSLDLWTNHRNEALKKNAVSFMLAQTKKYQAELKETKASLAKLVAQDPAHTAEYFQIQWDRQRALQLEAISVQTKEKRDRLGVLLTLEEELLDAHQRLVDMNAANAEIRTAEQRNELLDLPASLVALEVQIQNVADELGNAELLRARRGTDIRLKAILSVQVALGFLYEAAVGVIQEQAHAATRTGATQQPRNEQLRKKKRVLLKKKLDTYLRYASKYNQRFRPAQRLLEPTLDEVAAMDLLHPFWDEVALNHLDEPWASCPKTKEGILSLRNQLASEEELRRLGREARQLVGGVRVAEWNSIHSGLSKRTSRLWTHWERCLLEVVELTKDYVEGRVEADGALLLAWQQMHARTTGAPVDLLMLPILWAPEEGDEEAAWILQGGDEEEEDKRNLDFHGFDRQQGINIDWEMAL
ncbi:uncharacterized protein MELLADRAFT_108173 [Melampsora larici-populina 98AG31]|uniref:CxC1-like cysteine cluster associated with KDZ transposases domain-containing protein n=1 Tax=Melampsora larici-populina (strain 98AG31 / pathotype 3-4-7) TaxID=747676 RepID=F4RS80_MELLP|nr:uncharacterized protein MELLADRAFT_108173 [Melampsora larici-populina 98AG31]EGG04810.1 hypothetical protein MELLADRAFT_108173 [Melampsora larici-populina 98AG31]